jgi:hypothetical protein
MGPWPYARIMPPGNSIREAGEPSLDSPGSDTRPENPKAKDKRPPSGSLPITCKPDLGSCVCCTTFSLTRVTSRVLAMAVMLRFCCRSRAYLTTCGILTPPLSPHLCSVVRAAEGKHFLFPPNSQQQIANNMWVRVPAGYRRDWLGFVLRKGPSTSVCVHCKG